MTPSDWRRDVLERAHDLTHCARYGSLEDCKHVVRELNAMFARWNRDDTEKQWPPTAS